jgi:rhodanese-related sulfurtransferase
MVVDAVQGTSGWRYYLLNPGAGENRSHGSNSREVAAGQNQPAAASIGSMTPEELKQRLDAGDDLFVLDVREPSEYQISNLGGQLIPLNDLPKRLGELDAAREIVVHCKLGGRSAKAVEFLKQNGFARVHNLDGGINAWSERVDPKVAKY